ncbi:MAG: hypothetical protein IPL67_19880 [Ignavibacteria bacterium]|nr:hypothetical protein [Ignavibacteria bacterium]
MTVFATESYVEDEFDDVALLRTLEKIKSKLRVYFICKMPVSPYDNLLESFDETRRTNFLKALDRFIADGNAAFKEPNQLSSSKQWKKLLSEKDSPLGKMKMLMDKFQSLGKS